VINSLKIENIFNRSVSLDVDDADVYFIAEIGVNHECDIGLAKSMILSAKKGGADAVKFQVYKSDLLASKNAKSYWDTSKEKTTNQRKLFSKFDKFNKDDYLMLYDYCKSLNI